MFNLDPNQTFWVIIWMIVGVVIITGIVVDGVVKMKGGPKK